MHACMQRDCTPRIGGDMHASPWHGMQHTPHRPMAAPHGLLTAGWRVAVRACRYASDIDLKPRPLPNIVGGWVWPILTYPEEVGGREGLWEGRV